jgi:16S rRNA (adenine1518-N6/adenine1519-N6)-dimethyltransferase
MFKPIKNLGQNFLMDKILVRKMVGALNVVPGDLIVEIGPGLGILTHDLVEHYRDICVYAVEIDKRFVDKLNTAFMDNLDVNIIESNILDWLPTFKPERNYKILGSLPYYITSPIVHSIIKMEDKAEACVLLVQKEVAEKIAATSPDSSYLSSFVQTFYSVEYLFTVGREKFEPAPNVDGGVLKLILRKDLPISKAELKHYEGFLHKAYANPRKMLNKAFSKEELSLIDIDPNLRPQNVSAEQWTAAFKILSSQ